MPSKEEFQSKLDTTFPDGAFVTLLLKNNGPSVSDDDPQFLTTYITCLEVDNEHPIIALVSESNLRSFRFLLDEVIDRDDGFYAVTTSTDVPNLLLSNRLTDEQREYARQERGS